MTDHRKAWTVVIAGFGVNLVLGFLYSWGTISSALIEEHSWSTVQTQIPYMFASVTFALSMIPGGRFQDRRGPHVPLLLATLLAGVGFLGASYFLSMAGLTIFFGILFGLAMGFGYAAPTPAAVKWFHPQHRGFISGLVVSGYGLAPVYIAPLSHFFLSHYGLEKTFLLFALILTGTLLVLSRVITNPPPSFSPLVLSLGKRKSIFPKSELSVTEMVRTREFHLLWVLLFAGTFSGLLVIGQMSKIAQEIAGLEQGFLPVMFYALANFVGRLTWGALSDRVGRRKALFFAFTIQAVIFFVFEQMTNPVFLLLAKSGVGFTFGGMLALFPAICADYFGVKNLGLNYGVLFTAWGVGGTIGPLLGGLIRDITGVHTLSFFVSGCVSVMGMILVNFLKTAEKR
ncbi:MAG: L-lactate MFS transporter [Candidatus Caldatribacteriaceae bacterium]